MLVLMTKMEHYFWASITHPIQTQMLSIYHHQKYAHFTLRIFHVDTLIVDTSFLLDLCSLKLTVEVCACTPRDGVTDRAKIGLPATRNASEQSQSRKVHKCLAYHVLIECLSIEEEVWAADVHI